MPVNPERVRRFPRSMSAKDARRVSREGLEQVPRSEEGRSPVVIERIELKAIREVPNMADQAISARDTATEDKVYKNLADYISSPRVDVTQVPQQRVRDFLEKIDPTRRKITTWSFKPK
jgi:hypothetical protein